MKKVISIISLSLLLMLQISDGQTNVLIATCSGGGANNWGCIFQTDSLGNNFHIIYSFDSTNGIPCSNMVQANNGKVYGIGGGGGGWITQNCIFEFDPISGTGSNVHNFYPDSSNGYIAITGMIKGLDGTLYGLCDSGGLNHKGVIYSFDPNSHIYTNIFSFNDTLGGSPFGKLLELSTKKLYGMTNIGGAYGYGVIFCYDLSTNIYLDLHDFDSTFGSNPIYGGLIQATDGKLYGMTSYGGLNNSGVIFNFDLSTNVYTDIYDFMGYPGNGRNPAASLIQASNGKLYGMTAFDGTNYGGTIFSYDINTNTYTDLFNFGGNLLNGWGPLGNLYQYGNYLFGTVQCPNTNYGYGSAFKMKLTNHAVYDIQDFSPPNTFEAWGDFLAISISTGIPTINGNSECKLYPNPTSGTFTLSYNSQLSIPNSQLKIYDVLGQEVYTQPITNPNQTTINISQLSNGVYFYQLINNKETLRGKFIKQ